MKLAFRRATEADAVAIGALRNEASDALTRRFGQGHWSAHTSDNGVLRSILTSTVLVASARGAIVGTLQLQTKKPWAIDVSYFAASKRPLYLISMAVAPRYQRRGVGRAMMAKAEEVARDWPADAIRLDAYDSPAGAGGFYPNCGYAEVGRVVYRGVPLVYFERLFKPAGPIKTRPAPRRPST